jgi:hypothetical protein
LTKTYNYSKVFGEPQYFTRNVNYELNDEIKNINIHRILNFHLPLILIENLIKMIVLAMILYILHLGIKVIKNKFSVKIE